jgi:hypothetical protein
MPFTEAMHTYFRGERVEALAFILPLGLLLVVGGGLALRYERSAFTWGAAVPAIAGGLLLAVVGAVVGFRTNAQVADLERGYTEAPATMAAEELPRMEKVNASFRTTIVVFGVLAAMGLVFLFAVPFEWARGLGTGLLVVGALGLTIDGVASRRAVPYTAALQTLAQEPPPEG